MYACSLQCFYFEETCKPKSAFYKRETLNWIPYEAVENSIKITLWRQSDLVLLCLLKKIQSSVIFKKKILGSLWYTSTLLCIYMYWQMQTAIFMMCMFIAG